MAGNRDDITSISSVDENAEEVEIERLKRSRGEDGDVQKTRMQ